MDMNYREIERAIRFKQEFEHNGTMSAHWELSSVKPQKDVLVYVIRSYSTVIAELHSETLYFNSRKYSMTTSRQQNIVKRCASYTDVIEM